jgi:esterase/lipase superfamily enzyme
MRHQRVILVLSLIILVAGGFIAGRVQAVQSHIMAALDHLLIARNEVEKADRDKGGHRQNALHLITDAITELQRGVAFTHPDAPFTIVRVYYGTNRSKVPDKRVAFDYDTTQTTLSLGTATVSIPEDHRLGQWEKSLFDSMANQSDHVMLLTVIPQSTGEFTTSINERVARSSKKEAFVFVHGYNTTFQQAIERTAILAYDLKFDGAPIAFAWPSRAKPKWYVSDEEAAQTSVEDLENFLQLVAKDSGATSIHLIAHSMGNSILLQALRALQERQHQPTNLANLVLVAPDVRVAYFQQLMGHLRDVPRRATLYASSRDRALIASREFHDFPRAGEAGSGILVLDGMDSIDVSAVDTSLSGHSYIGDNRSVISDLYYLISGDDPPEKRVCLSPRHRATYWVFDRCR